MKESSGPTVSTPVADKLSVSNRNTEHDGAIMHKCENVEWCSKTAKQCESTTVDPTVWLDVRVAAVR